MGECVGVVSAARHPLRGSFILCEHLVFYQGHRGFDPLTERSVDHWADVHSHSHQSLLASVNMGRKTGESNPDMS